MRSCAESSQPARSLPEAIVVILSVLRHAATDWNDAGRMQGRRDIPLNARGRDDISRWTLPDAMRRDAEWHASPLSRAMETARLLRGAAPAVEEALIEMDWGGWEGYRLDELRTRFGDAFAQNERRGLDFRPPGGESPRDVIARLAPWLRRIATHERDVVAVTHNGVLRALISIATGWDMLGKAPFKLRPATVHRFALTRDGRPSLAGVNVPLCVPQSA